MTDSEIENMLEQVEAAKDLLRANGVDNNIVMYVIPHVLDEINMYLDRKGILSKPADEYVHLFGVELRKWVY